MSIPTERTPGEKVKMTVSERSPEVLATALRTWLADRLGTTPEISGVRVPESGGLSSTSVLLKRNGAAAGKLARVLTSPEWRPSRARYPSFPGTTCPASSR